MKKRFLSRLFSSVMTAALVVSTMGTQLTTITAAAEEGSSASIQLSDSDVEILTGDADYDRTSVHDPSVVYDNNGTYYIFGSHMAVSKSTDLENWTDLYTESEDSALFGVIEGCSESLSVSESSATDSSSEETDSATDSSSEDAADSTKSSSEETDAAVNASSEDAASSEVSLDEAETDDATEGSDAATKASTEELTSDIVNYSAPEGTSSGVIVQASYNDAFVSNAYTGTVQTTFGELDFGENYDIASWISDNTVSGNMWAPDVIYNDTLGKWCMYLSLNGAKWNSAVILLTADDIEGPYVYQGPVVFSGFSTTDSSKSFKNTDLELVIGEQDELPEKYQKIADETWGTYWPHAIDPCVYYDEDGKLWLAYGSWSGGIYELELDEETGLRDYTVTYDSDYDTLGASVTSDEYFGTKIAGGYYVSGEGSYIQHIGDYYYLFMSYGFYSPEGGYNMRIFRSSTPDGDYVDENGNSAIFNKYIMNYSATDTSNNRGMKLMGGYQWENMDKAELSQGHNSVITDSEGKSYVIYHTKFNDGTATHEVRVHQLFTNEKGWLIAAPYEYSGETLEENGYSKDEVVGTYGFISHDFQMAYSKLAYNTPVDITLGEDGTISGEYTGTWTMTDGTPYCQLTINDEVYYGVFTEQVLDGSNVSVMCFTAMSDDGLSVWGSGEITDEAAVALDAVDSANAAPSVAFGNITLSTEGSNGSAISWTSSDTAIVADDGTVTTPAQDTVVTLTATISKGDYYYVKDYDVTIKATAQNSTDSIVVGEYYTGVEVDLSKISGSSLSVPSPFYEGTISGLDLSGGVTIEFDATSTGTTNVLATIFAFLANSASDGRLYFTPGSYLGYNAGGYYYDANLTDYALVEDYIGDGGHVAVNLTQTGFSVSVDGVVCFTEEIIDTDAGAATLTDYSKVLKWLSESADTLMFGYGSWWTDQTANVTISNVVCSVGPTCEWSEEEEETITYEAVSYSKDSIELTSNSFLETEENPFYGKNISNLDITYTINMTEGTAQNGWDGILSFYNSTSKGRVSVQTAPYVCYNDSDGNWIDVNQPGSTNGTNVAPDMVPGTDYTVNIKITQSDLVITVDGEEITLGYNGSGADYKDLLDFVTTCDQLTWGVGLASTAYWNTELCTLSNISISSEAEEATAGESDDEEEETDTPNTAATVSGENTVVNEDGSIIYTVNEVVLDTTGDITIGSNPFEGADFNKLEIEYTINMTAGTAKNGWDGIFSFYESASTGRVSMETAPYICYNDFAGNWIDINQPGVDGGTNAATSMIEGEDTVVNVVITDEDITVTVNGEEISIGTNGSETASYATLLDFLATCDQFSWGVGTANTAFWNTELCTISNVKMTASNEEEAQITEENLFTHWAQLYCYDTDMTTVIKDSFVTIDGNTYYFGSTG
ncbi:MAG: glycoside hydrolase family 43 protein, partial [Butyrivibrio sp.]|nr:glycoside hydrolase family 43 protein [Butyrivibrio sp.]